MSKKSKRNRPPVAAFRNWEAEQATAMRLNSQGKVDEAVEMLSEMLEMNPTRTDTLRGLADVLVEAGRIEEAADALIVLKTHVPRDPRVRYVFGTVLGSLRQFRAAEEELLEAVRLAPFDAEFRVALAQVYEQTGADDKAADEVKHAVRLSPNNLQLACHAAGVLHHAGRGAEAIGLLASRPPRISGSAEARLSSALMMPIIAKSVEEIEEVRERLRLTVKELAGSGLTIEHPEKTVKTTCFLLGYHGLEDRPLIQSVAETHLKLCPSLGYVSPNLERRPLSDRRLKVGFLSSNMRVHSVGRVLNRFLRELDRERFEVLLFELPGKFGGGQEQAREVADRTIFVPGELIGARKAVEAELVDVLVIPDFVMDPFNDYLAYSRLAPVQCSTWGHPGTSGRPSMDYWISCADWEPAGNERLYTERLVRLSLPPMIATALAPPDPVESRESLGLPDGRLYACPQSLYKIHPEFDGYIGGILRRDAGGKAVLIGGVQPKWVDVYRERFRRNNADVEDRLVFLPHLTTTQYLSLLSHCVVSLDPVHFGGANTSMEAFTMGLPVVTQPGGQLRNRQTVSFYNMMGMSESPLVVHSQEAYIEIALSVALNPDLRRQLSEMVSERCRAIFDTIGVTRELEQFFVQAAKEAIG